MSIDNENYISLRRLGEFKELLDRYKQDKLTVGVNLDNGVKSGSLNPITANGVHSAIKPLVDAGAKNHINYTLTTIKNINTAGTWNGNIYSINGVTYTVNDDMTITANGTATGNTSLVLKKFDPQELIGYVGYILSGCPTGGSDETYRLEIQRAGSPWTRYVMNYGEGVQIPDVGDSFAVQTQCFLTVQNGVTVSSLTFKPMICTATDYEASPVYQPYALPNTTITPALIKQVNEGAKNLAKFDIWAKQCSLVRGTKTINGNGSITITATSSDCYTLFSPTEFPVECRIPVTPGTEMVATWEEAETGTGNKYIYFFPNGSTSGLIAVKASDEVETFTVPADCEYLTWRIGCSTSGDTVTFNNLMICSAADYAVSSAYVLYAPTNRELYEMSPRKKSIRHNFTTSDYEEIPECSVTVPPNKMALIVASLKWNNSYPRGIKMSTGSISQSDRIFGIAESENNYAGITAHGLLTNTNTDETTVQIYAKSASAGGNDVNIVYWIL